MCILPELKKKKQKENGHQSQTLYKIYDISSCLDLQSSFRRCRVGYEEKEEYEQKNVSKHHMFLYQAS